MLAPGVGLFDSGGDDLGEHLGADTEVPVSGGNIGIIGLGIEPFAIGRTAHDDTGVLQFEGVYVDDGLPVILAADYFRCHQSIPSTQSLKFSRAWRFSAPVRPDVRPRLRCA